MDIKYANMDDLSGCNEVDSDLGFHTEKTIFKKSLGDKRLIVASENDTVLGYLRYGYIWEEELPYIQMIRVSKQSQGKGVGKSLIKFLENELIRKRIKTLISSTDETNSVSLSFHRNIGFSECGKLDINEGSEKEIFLKKEL